jgi:hypothetical protein
MARRVAAGIAVALALAVPASALRAQTLQHLTVQSFDLSADTTAPKVGVPFHLIVTLRVRERVAHIDNLDLPMLAQLELLGDERETLATSHGTQYRERIAVAAHVAGSLAIAAATLQAIDARDGKPKQWYTNILTLNVGGAPLQVPRISATAMLWAVGAFLLLLIAIALFYRRPRGPVLVAATPAPAPVTQAPPLERSRRQQAHDALLVLSAERTRPAAVTVRAAIWRMIGASDGETLADVLQRPEARETSLRGLLIALERSAFTYDSDLCAAIDDACSALDRYIESAA